MSNQVPSIGRVVHYVKGDKHFAAIITDPDWHGGGEQSLTILPPQSEPFWEISSYSEQPKNGTWHWPEYVPAQEK